MSRQFPEDAIQRAVFEHLAVRGAPGIFAFHPANGGYRRPVEAARLKELGVRPGVPDVVAVHRGKVYAIELKREGGRATDAQLQAAARLKSATASIARSPCSKAGACCAAVLANAATDRSKRHADR